jgi:enamine deaminase RidA (YjgF/YER057c/UK114 family)
MADIVKLNYFLVAEVERASVPKLRPIRDRYLNVAQPPASTFVVVSRLSRPGWLIEIEAVAALDD